MGSGFSWFKMSTPKKKETHAPIHEPNHTPNHAPNHTPIRELKPELHNVYDKIDDAIGVLGDEVRNIPQYHMNDLNLKNANLLKSVSVFNKASPTKKGLWGGKRKTRNVSRKKRTILKKRS